MAKLARKVFARVVGKPFLRALMFPFAVVLMLAYAADATTDWQAARREVAGTAPLVKTVIFSTLFSVWALIAGRALRPVWGSGVIAFLVRQPLSSWEWVVFITPSLSIALVPIGFFWWLASFGADPFAHYLGFLGLPLAIVLGYSLNGRKAVLAAAAMIGLLALLMHLYWFFPLIGYAGAVVGPLLLQQTVRMLLRQGPAVAKAHSSRLVSSSVIGALVLRDWRGLVRTRPSVPRELLTLAALASLMMLAFRVNGEVRGEDALDMACLLYLLAGCTTYRNLEIVKARLGPQIVRASWPVSHLERGLAVSVLAGILMSASVLPLALIGSRMGPMLLLVFFAFVALSSCLTAALFVCNLRNDSSSVGLFINLCVFEGILVYALPPWSFLAVAAGLIGLSLLLFRTCLATYAGRERWSNAP